MKVILHKKPDGGVARHSPNLGVLADMTATPFDYTQLSDDEATQRRAKIEQAIVKRMLPSKDWLGFTREFATEWFQARFDGGLTEDEAWGLFSRRVQLRRGYTASAVIDDTSLPYHMLGNGDPEHGSCLNPNCQDRYFRDAVVWNDTAAGKCTVDIAKARVIHLAEIRRVRNEELVKKDITFMRAVEAGDTSAQSTIATEKQTLRDIPATFDITTGVTTPEQLKVRWPDQLPARE